MGYTTEFEGQLTIQPSLSRVDLEDYAANWYYDGTSFRAALVREYSYGHNQWECDYDGDFLEWDGGEKFYCYTEILNLIIEKFFKPRGYILNGTLEWQGEAMGDRGVIFVRDNEVRSREYPSLKDLEDRVWE